MVRIAEAVVRFHKVILVVFIVAAVICVLLALGVKVNYDMTKYLPQDSNLAKSVEVLEDSFGYPEVGTVMLRDLSIPQVIQLKEEIEELDGVYQVMWLDDVADITQPIEFLDSDLTDIYYKDGNALLQITYFENGYSPLTSKTINTIRNILTDRVGEDGYAMGGSQFASKALAETADKEVTRISIIVALLILIILLLLTDSWLAPVLYLGVIGVAVIINMGTNIFFGEISNVSQSTQAILQLAISMDYSIFLFERFSSERASGAIVEDAVKTAIMKSTTALAGSSITTVAGFLALWFMDYGIGFDLGRVLVKGILISLISVMTLLPVLIKLTAPLLEKSSHRSLLPRLRGYARFTQKAKLMFIGLCILLMIPAFLAQQNNNFIYGETGINREGSDIYEEELMISGVFGEQNQAVIMVPLGHFESEAELSEVLGKKDYVKSVQSISALADPAIPIEFLPTELTENFVSEDYARIILMLDVPLESEETFGAVEDLENTISEYYEEYYLAGNSTAIYDIKQVVETDYQTVNTISIIAVMLIILFVFRSLSLPFILTFVIEVAIWLNMAIPYFAGSTLSFVGYLIISSVQLGATIDYAILLTDRYMEFRETLPKREAAIEAVVSAGGSIFTSFLILGSAGLSLGFISQTAAISELGILIGRGAFISGIMVLTLLPALLVLFDGAIMRTTLTSEKLAARSKRKGRE